VKLFKKQFIDFINLKSKFEGGFTLIETLVAISILATALVGPMTIASRSIASAGYAKDQMTAFFLAEEAVEYVRNTRDNNALAGDSWLTNLSACMNEECTINALALNNNPGAKATACPGGVCPPLSYNSASGLYGYGSGAGWSPTVFTREVIFNELVADREVEILVTISWSVGRLQRSFVVSENLLNWQL